MIFFSKRNKKDGYKNPIFYGHEIIPFKYLAIILDEKLSWKNHIDHVYTRAIKSINVCRNLIGTYWGLTPRMMKYAYEMLIRPIISYGSIIWNENSYCLRIGRLNTNAIIQKIQIC